jgi:hypothetical protein
VGTYLRNAAREEPTDLALFDITKSRTIPEDVVAVELYNLWRRTTDTAVFLSIPPDF